VARVTRRRRPGFNLGSHRYGAAAFRRALWAEAHQARRLPRTAPQVTGRCGPRRIPLPRPLAPRPGREPRAGCADRRESVTDPGPERRALSGSAPPASRAPGDRFKTAPQKRSPGPTLERRSLCRPSGPDGEGQAGGQARSARGERTHHRSVMALSDWPCYVGHVRDVPFARAHRTV
jgi:hypothetical protein